jgi:hypothetical protein
MPNCRWLWQAKQTPVGGSLINDAHANPAHWLVGVYRKSFRVENKAADRKANALSRRQRGRDEVIRQVVGHPQQFES